MLSHSKSVSCQHLCIASYSQSPTCRRHRYASLRDVHQQAHRRQIHFPIKGFVLSQICSQFGGGLIKVIPLKALVQQTLADARHQWISAIEWDGKWPVLDQSTAWAPAGEHREILSAQAAFIPSTVDTLRRELATYGVALSNLAPGSTRSSC